MPKKTKQRADVESFSTARQCASQKPVEEARKPDVPRIGAI